MFSVSQTPPHSPPKGQKARQVWTPAEDQLLARAVQLETPQTGSISWCRVAAHLPHRNNKDCRKRWHYSIAHDIRKGTWTREEDQKLRDAVVIHGTRWSKIAELVGTRNGDQCWKRWYDCLDPQIDKSPWTPEEDTKLLRTVAKHGRNWTGIVNQHFPKRTSLSAKNRYSILQRKQEVRSSSRAPALPSSQKFSERSSPGVPNPSQIQNTSSDLFDNAMSSAAYNVTETPEPDYNSLPYQHHHLQPGYWSSANLSTPSGASTPDSAQGDLADWRTWDMVPPDSSQTQYGIDNGSYLSPSPISLQPPEPDYVLVCGGYYNPLSGGLNTLSMHTVSPSPSSYSSVYQMGGAITGADISPDTQCMMSTYRASNGKERRWV